MAYYPKVLIDFVIVLHSREVGYLGRLRASSQPVEPVAYIDLCQYHSKSQAVLGAYTLGSDFRVDGEILAVERFQIRS